MYAKSVREFTGVERSCAAECNEGEITRVMAALKRDDAERLLHVGVGDTGYAKRRLLRSYVE